MADSEKPPPSSSQTEKDTMGANSLNQGSVNAKEEGSEKSVHLSLVG